MSGTAKRATAITMPPTTQATTETLTKPEEKPQFKPRPMKHDPHREYLSKPVRMPDYYRRSHSDFAEHGGSASMAASYGFGG